MGHVGKFESVTLQPDGAVEVSGAFSPFPGGPTKPALVAFYLEQDTTKVDGEGRWLPGQKNWMGTGGKGLKAGPAHGTAIAVLPHDDFPGFVTFTWNSSVDVT